MKENLLIKKESAEITHVKTKDKAVTKEGNEGQKSGDKPCRKSGHNHKGKYFPDNRFGAKYQGNESNTNEIIPTRRRNEREYMYEDDNSCNLMIDEMISDDDEDTSNLEKCYDLDSEDKIDEEDSYLLRNGRSGITKEKPTKKIRARIILSLEDKNGNRTEYLGLLDIGNSSGLISKELVENMGSDARKLLTFGTLTQKNSIQEKRQILTACISRNSTSKEK